MVGYEQYKEDVKAGKLLNMITIIEKNRDMPLFKYTSSLEHCLDMLINERIFLNSAGNFNDPYDSLPAKKEIKVKDEFNRIIEAYANNCLRMKAAEFQKTVKVACFSERVNSSIMWGHYADSHQGFCLEYKVKDILSQEEGLLFPVVYTDVRFLDGECELPEFKESFNEIRSVILKELDWKYEQEWRYIIKSGKQQDEYIKLVKPRALYIGARNNSVKDRMLSELCRYCKDNSIALHIMTSNIENYEMKPLNIFEATKA